MKRIAPSLPGVPLNVKHYITKLSHSLELRSNFLTLWVGMRLEVRAIQREPFLLIGCASI
jgi:hypothetical protein